MTGLYILAGHEPVVVEEDGILEWALWLSTADRKVAKTTVSDGVQVSTVFLGMEHGTVDGRPLLFETLVFGGERDGEMWRTCTWERAELAHEARVKQLEEEMEDNAV